MNAEIFIVLPIALYLHRVHYRRVNNISKNERGDISQPWHKRSKSFTHN